MFLTKEVWELRLTGGRVDESLVKREHVGECTALLVDLFGERVREASGSWLQFRHLPGTQKTATFS